MSFRQACVTAVFFAGRLTDRYFLSCPSGKPVKSLFGIAQRPDLIDVEIFLVIPRQPFFGVGGNGGGLALEGGEVIEGVGVVEFAGVDQAHEEIPHVGTVLRW